MAKQKKNLEKMQRHQQNKVNELSKHHAKNVQNEIVNSLNSGSAEMHAQQNRFQES